MQQKLRSQVFAKLILKVLKMALQLYISVSLSPPRDLALHFLLKDQVTLAPDPKHQLWSVYEWLGDSKWSVNLFMMFISHLK